MQKLPVQNAIISVEKVISKPDLVIFNIWPEVRNTVIKKSFLNEKFRILLIYPFFSLKKVNFEIF